MTHENSFLHEHHKVRALPRRVQVGILGALASAALLAAFAPTLFARPQPAVETAAPPAPGTFRATDAQWANLKLAKVEQRAFRTEEETDGKIAIDDDTTTPVFSQFSGRVTAVYAKAGDRVKKGDPLFAVEATEFVQAQNDLIAAVAAETTARAQLNLAESAEKRQHELYEAKGGALKDWQQAQVDLANARGGYRTAQVALAAVRNRLRILGMDDKRIDAIEHARDGRHLSAEATVPAPIGGTVVQRQVGVGQYIASNAANPVFSIGDLSTVWLVANVREAQAAQVHVGDAVQVHALAWPGRSFDAKVTFVAPSIDPATRRLAVRAQLENTDGALKPEMFARFRIITGAESAAAAVPEDAILYEGGKARVWVAQADKTLVLRNVELGRKNDGLVEVVAGVSPGETLVTGGALFIDRAAQVD